MASARPEPRPRRCSRRLRFDREHARKVQHFAKLALKSELARGVHQDDSQMRETVTAMLESIGFRVTAVGGANAAIALIESDIPWGAPSGLPPRLG